MALAAKIRSASDRSSGGGRLASGLPSSVDKSAFEIGRNLCLSPGSVVFKSEVLELIHYKPTAENVYTRPLVITPPQVNKFYALDLSPEKSFVKYAAAQGLKRIRSS